MGSSPIPIAINILLLLAGVSIVVYTIRTGITPAPSSRKATNRVLATIPPDSDGTIVDLGSGWGTLLFPLARAFPSCTVIGYELSPVPWLASKIKAVLFQRHNLIIHRKDLFKENLSEASVIVCYLHPAAMTKLRPKLERELQPGALVICNTFPVPSWTPQEVHDLGGILSKKIYVYKV